VDRLLRAIGSLNLLLWAHPAFAVTVAIVQPARPSATLTETASRLHGECLSVGLDVTFIALPSHRDVNPGDRSSWLESIAEQGNLDAVVEIVGESESRAVEVWVHDKPNRRMIVSTVALGSDAKNPSENLAVRAVEVLRSTLLANDMSVQKRSKPANEEPAGMVAPRGEFGALPPHPKQFGIELGATAVLSLDRLGPAILPLARFDYAALPQLTISLSLAGFGVHPNIATTLGSASVAEQYVVLGGHYRFATNRTLWPFVGVSAGALHTAVEGRASSPNQGHGVDSWSLLVDASFGTGLQLHHQYFLSAAMHVELAEPYVAIHFNDAVVATSGRPNLALGLTAGAWL
jgi:hypothetical protein